MSTRFSAASRRGRRRAPVRPACRGAGIQRSDQADAARLDRPAHHHADHGRGAEEGRLQRRICAGRLSRPVRRAEDRRPARRHGDLGDDRPEAMDEAVATGNVENLGETGMQAKEEWWYPELHEGEVPRPAELGGAEGDCARGVLDRRDRAEGPLSRRTGDLGRLRRGARRGARASPSRWCMPAPTRRSSPSWNRAYQRQAPIMLWIYAPHWAPAKYKGEWVEFPPYEQGLLRAIRPGAPTPTPRTIAASRAGRSGRSAGPA